MAPSQHTMTGYDFGINFISDLAILFNVSQYQVLEAAGVDMSYVQEHPRHFWEEIVLQQLGKYDSDTIRKAILKKLGINLNSAQLLLVEQSAGAIGHDFHISAVRVLATALGTSQWAALEVAGVNMSVLDGQPPQHWDDIVLQQLGAGDMDTIKKKLLAKMAI